MISLNINAQRIRGFVGGSYFVNSDNKNSGYIGMEGGLEIKVFNNFRPEIEMSFLFSELEERVDRDDLGNITSVFDRSVTAFNYSFISKFGFYSRQTEMGDAFIHILPKYTISRIEAKGNYAVVNQNDFSKSIFEKETIVEWSHSLGVGVGIDLMLSNVNYSSLSLNIVYDGVEMGNAVAKLTHSGPSRYFSKTIGFGVNYYFGFVKRPLK